MALELFFKFDINHPFQGIPISGPFISPNINFCDIQTASAAVKILQMMT